jgi:hypothetical protein
MMNRRLRGGVRLPVAVQRTGASMQQFEFQTFLPADATVTIPPEIAVQVEQNRPIRIVMLVPDPLEDREWSTLTASQFFHGYADEDAIYDRLPTR